MPDVTETITVAASPEALYALVSDLPRMGEWSPECTGVTWSARTPGPAVGARFTGRNRAGAARWLTQGRVLEATPARTFTFAIHFGPIPIALWSYTFTPLDAGVLVTESWTDRRPAPLRLAMNAAFGDRADLNRRGMRTTLERLRSTAESAHAPS
ncbi:SRPBCC family protein [Kribbella sandramycini]|uniref:SRPBCC family protein n=1 Tax=Kribbella sandramycini TaxID=60450 RepID=A0A7Y4KVL1_9ACTN|nr:SRPBCC family protein [Kribbella sandramycini]MBB6568037.1 hypothetical protein [Kribbella sandramycini]NOL39369.1 SRPBCC family protein [Kribbella sandramycini]